MPKLSLEELHQIITSELEDRKGEQITTIDLKGKADFADEMIIASGTSSRHIASMAEALIKRLKASGYERVPAEGLESADWVLVDAGNIIVHLFRPEVRERYALEKMWSVVMPQEAEE